MNTRKTVETNAERMVYVNVSNQAQQIDFKTENLGTERMTLVKGKYWAKEHLVDGVWKLRVARYK